jgi:hypothetical protein
MQSKTERFYSVGDQTGDVSESRGKFRNFGIVKIFTTVTGYVRVPVKVKEKKEENKKSKKSRASAAGKPSELNEPRWSVVSFEARAASNLTYEQAAEKLAELAAQKVAGLCIITDEAAARIDRKRKAA